MKPNLQPWGSDLLELYSEIWKRLTFGILDRHAPARHPTLATTTAEGRPKARTVVLRAADKVAGTLDIHTDLRSAKVGELRATPFAALHVWDPLAHLQLRIEAQVTLLAGQDAAEMWKAVPAASRLSYGSSPAPGEPIPQALDYTKAADAGSFVVLRLKVDTLEALYLGQNHCRARFDRSDAWTGTWLAP